MFIALSFISPKYRHYIGAGSMYCIHYIVYCVNKYIFIIYNALHDIKHPPIKMTPSGVAH